MLITCRFSFCFVPPLWSPCEQPTSCATSYILVRRIFINRERPRAYNVPYGHRANIRRNIHICVYISTSILDIYTYIYIYIYTHTYYKCGPMHCMHFLRRTLWSGCEYSVINTPDFAHVIGTNARIVILEQPFQQLCIHIHATNHLSHPETVNGNACICMDMHASACISPGMHAYPQICMHLQSPGMHAYSWVCVYLHA